MPREDFEIEVMLNILNPFESFTPKFVSAEMINISEQSIRLRTIKLTRSETEILQKSHHVSKIGLYSPTLGKRLTVKAVIFWAKYYLTDEEEPPYADLGFNLKSVEENDRWTLVEFVNLWRAGEASEKA